MAFAQTWDVLVPDGSVQTVSTLDNHIKDFKVAVEERMEGDPADANTGVFQAGSWAAAPKLKNLRGIAGSLTNVSYGKDGDQNTGMYFPAADQVALAAGGVQMLLATATTVTLPLATTITAGGLTITAGGLAVTADRITMAAAVSQLVPGITSFAIRDNADAFNNLIITNAGAATFRSTVGGITTLTATTVVAALTGNATTATTLQTARTINGVSFDGSANITVTAAAETLTGTTLNATVVTSSLTSVGTLTSLSVSGDVFINDDAGLVVGHTALLAMAELTSELQVLGTVDTDSAVGIGRWAASASSASLRFFKSRGATIGSQAPVVIGDNLGEIRVYGDDGIDNDTNSSAIIFDTEGTIATGQVPGVIKLQTAAAGSLANALTLNSSQNATFAGTGTFAGLVLTPATVAGSAGLRLPHGTTPTSPVDGDIWTTTTTIFARINGVSQDLVATVGSHILADTTGLGSTHTTSGLTAGQVLRATGATTAAFQSLVAADIPSLDTAKIATGTFADARIAVGNVTQHQAAITGTGAVNSGSITSGHGDIDIGTNALTAGIATLSGKLDLAGDVEIASRDITLGVGANDDVASGIVPIQRVSSAFVGSFISGFSGGRPDRILYISNVGNNSVILRHDEATSVAANRFFLPSAADLTLVVHGGIGLWYDDSDSRWRVLTRLNNL